jgi:hypothetical protein
VVDARTSAGAAASEPAAAPGRDRCRRVVRRDGDLGVDHRGAGCMGSGRPAQPCRRAGTPGRSVRDGGGLPLLAPRRVDDRPVHARAGSRGHLDLAGFQGRSHRRRRLRGASRASSCRARRGRRRRRGLPADPVRPRARQRHRAPGRGPGVRRLAWRRLPHRRATRPGAGHRPQAPADLLFALDGPLPPAQPRRGARDGRRRHRPHGVGPSGWTRTAPGSRRSGRRRTSPAARWATSRSRPCPCRSRW